MSNPLDSASGKAINSIKKKKLQRRRMIVGSIVIFIVSIGSIAAYIQTSKSAQLLNERQRTKNARSDVSTSAASMTKSSSKDVKPSTSPSVVAANDAQELEKAEAIKNGTSHIDNSSALSSTPEQKVDFDPASKKQETPKKEEINKKPESTKAEVKAETKPVEEKKPTRKEIVNSNMAKLFKSEVKSYHPTAFNTTAYVSNFESKYTIGTSLSIIPEGDVGLHKNPHVLSIKEEKLAKEQAKAEEIEKNKVALENNKSNDDKAVTEDMVRILNMGDKAVGQITEAINSDYGLDVFIDLYDPPLTGVRVRAQFELNPYQDGILLKVTELQFKDYRQSITGYAVDILQGSKPLFDNEVDTHFAERFWARGSAAFIAPWLDFVTASSTTVVNDGVVIETPNVVGTVDRIVGSLASVAKEFLPDLQKRADIPPTVSVPMNYPAAVVFSEPLYLPKGLFDADPETEPDQSFETVFPNYY
ncbi:hypothetical protein ACTFQF_00865 [Aliivibrio fischeri]|uniref:Uncharacterized protein n=1 Tax=Aliivibrio fischeri (strain MJ11) TaxID=388396 RepID=B5EW72_ALIFM|nr:hypothetical protein [Aliivibrio fischeri]ACH64814.1 hypothetical protein VFMJ11_B0129 [Aliivibrio fischeri MJ11]MUK37602.1 hypothetical protein [Aliivibrio fischeri]